MAKYKITETIMVGAMCHDYWRLEKAMKKFGLNWFTRWRYRGLMKKHGVEISASIFRVLDEEGYIDHD